MELSVDRLNELLRLDAETGDLYWRADRGQKPVGGKSAGSLDSKGYRRVKIDYRAYRAHRVVFAIAHGRWPVMQLDHINRNKLDNRPCNLREVSPSENSMNRRRAA
jgi:hypothetical protein